MRQTREASGRYVVVAGPDGTGKTTVADLLADVARADGPLLHLHHRPRVLGGLTTHQGPVTEPHRHPPYPWVISCAKVLYLFADHLLGSALRFRPVIQRGGTVLMERGWWDLAVDPRRYRLRPHPYLVRVLGSLLPKPTVTFLLVADPDVLTQRTDELDEAELRRQVDAWLSLPHSWLRPIVIDSAGSLDTVIDKCRRSLKEVSKPDVPPQWVALPRPSRARWLVPRKPRRATRNGLRVYTPVTPRAISGWLLASVAARAGAASLLPSAPRPQAMLDEVRDVLPRGGTVAVGHSTHAGRFMVTLLDARGDAVAVAKLASDERGQAALTQEHEALEQVRGFLPPGLHAPALLDARKGRLLYEAVKWQPRLRPWRLPEEVAERLGQLYRAKAPAGAAPATGIAHGDCAPWNLLRGQERWYLIDWSDARVDAPPFTDLWHYIVQAHALLGRPSKNEILEGFVERGWVGAAIAAYAHGAGLRRQDAYTHLLPYLLRPDVSGQPGRADDRRGRLARQRLLAALGGARA